MVYNGKPYEQMDDLGVPIFLGTPIYIYVNHYKGLYITGYIGNITIPFKRVYNWLFYHIGDYNTVPKLCHDYFINHDIRIPALNNQDDSWKVWDPGFCSWLICFLIFWLTFLRILAW